MSRVTYFNETSCAAPNIRFHVAPCLSWDFGREGQHFHLSLNSVLCAFI